MFFEIVKMLIAFVTCMVPPQKDRTLIGYELDQTIILVWSEIGMDPRDPFQFCMLRNKVPNIDGEFCSLDMEELSSDERAFGECLGVWRR